MTHRLNRTGGPDDGLFQHEVGFAYVDFKVNNCQSDFDIDDRQSDDISHDGVVDKGVSAVPGTCHGL
ncbi:MAG: hypothetical protein ABSC73_02430 [Acidimicrobiales bacterium]